MKFATLLKSTRSLIKRWTHYRDNAARAERVREYHASGRVPWSKGYADWREYEISRTIRDHNILNKIRDGFFPDGYGKGLDERIAEYGWLFSRMRSGSLNFLDAGSTFNFSYLLNTPQIENRSTYIYTYSPESPSFPERRISYVYGDLRSLPFRNEYFDEIICQSTLEHIDMDNSIYGYNLPSKHRGMGRSFEYLNVVYELVRVLRPNGQLMITVPFGAFEHHGFFQQFDNLMIERLLQPLCEAGDVHVNFLLYTPAGWIFSTQEGCSGAISYNPHTGVGKLNDGAAHCRSVCCVAVTRHS